MSFPMAGRAQENTFTKLSSYSHPSAVEERVYVYVFSGRIAMMEIKSGKAFLIAALLTLPSKEGNRPQFPR